MPFVQLCCSAIAVATCNPSPLAHDRDSHIIIVIFLAWKKNRFTYRYLSVSVPPSRDDRRRFGRFHFRSLYCAHPRRLTVWNFPCLRIMNLRLSETRSRYIYIKTPLHQLCVWYKISYLSIPRYASCFQNGSLWCAKMLSPTLRRPYCWGVEPCYYLLLYYL